MRFFPSNNTSVLKNYLLVFGLILLLSRTTNAEIDGFATVDTDKNGVIDRNEFSVLQQNVKQNLSPLLNLGPKEQLPFQGYLKGGQFSPQLYLDNISFGFWTSFINSLGMIIVTELGDKTFFIAAILAMRHDRLLVFSGAIGALWLMTVLSAIMGLALPALLPRIYTHYASALLFLYFGIRLLKDATQMESSGPSEELHEVENELINKKEGMNDDGQNYSNKMEDEESTDFKKSRKTVFYPQSNYLDILTKSFTLTFLAEWGDRSQIATIALAAAKDPYGVTLGGCIGHAACTGLAVLGGRILAAKISEKTVAIVGGILFLLFGAHSLVVGV